MIYLQSVCILHVNQAVRETAGLSAQWPFTSVMLVMPVFLFLSARQYSCGESNGPTLLALGLESVSSFHYLCSCPCVYESFHICTCLSIGVRRAAGARLNSCYTQVTPSRIIHVCLRVFAFHLCIRLCTALFQVLIICLLCLLLPSIFFVSSFLGQTPLRCECDQV